MKTPLLRAIEGGWLSIIRLLIENGSDVNVKDMNFSLALI